MINDIKRTEKLRIWKCRIKWLSKEEISFTGLMWFGRIWPVFPAPASSAVSPEALPGPRPHVASHSSARPAAHSGYSSWGCPSNDQRCVPSDAEERSITFHKIKTSLLHFTDVGIQLLEKRSEIMYWHALTCWFSPASALPGLWLAVAALSGRSEPLPLSASPLSAPLEDVPHWCHLVAMCSSRCVRMTCFKTLAIHSAATLLQVHLYNVMQSHTTGLPWILLLRSL